MDQSGHSPAVQQKIVYAGTVSRSFAEGAALLARLAGVPIGVKEVERLCRRIGSERVAERDAQVAAYRALSLKRKSAVPAGVVAPELAVVMADGGRLQILERGAAAEPAAAEPAAAEPAAAESAAAEPAPPAAHAAGTEAWEPERPAHGHWREDKVAVLLTMASATCATDPCPDVPPCFLDAARMDALARELSRHVRTPDAAASGTAAPALADAPAADVPASGYQPPAVVQRQVVASRLSWPAFAPVVAQAAWAQGFQQAARKAFLGDGSANHWRLQRRFFASFEPILDFIHALSYVYAAARAGRSAAAGWDCYQQWIRWVWQGQVTQVIAALQQRQAEVGLPPDDEPATSPRAVVARALTYLGNQQGKMRYAEYRRRGLPVTSSLMESAVKQVNRRVKGTEKFWSEPGAEALLQLRADQLSDGEPLEAFWQRRQRTADGRRRYRRAA